VGKTQIQRIVTKEWFGEKPTPVQNELFCFDVVLKRAFQPLFDRTTKKHAFWTQCSLRNNTDFAKVTSWKNTW